MNWKNTLTETLQIKYPFIQAPMLGVTKPEMVAAISNAGALGSLPVGGLPPDKTLDLIQQTKIRTEKTFAVNVFANSFPASVNEETWRTMREFIEQYARRRHLPYEAQSLDDLKFISYEDQLDILLSEKIPVVSFTFGILSDEAIKALHDNGTLLMGTATSVEEARLLDDKGIDMIVAQGIEAGGHRGSFLSKDVPQTGLMALLPQMVDATDRPVVAAGAIADGRSIRAAMILGAQGVQAGSAFIACKESAANAIHKEAVQKTADTDTVLTRSYTGKWLRCIKNEFIETIDSSGLEINAYPVQAALTIFLRIQYHREDAAEYLPMLSGQNNRKTSGMSASEILLSMIREAESLE